MRGRASARPVLRRRSNPSSGGAAAPAGGRGGPRHRHADRPADACRELDRGRAGRRPLRLLPPQPGALPVAVVLGLLLPRDRLAALRPEQSRAGAPQPARRRAGGRVHRPYDLLGPPRRLAAPLDLQRHVEERAEHLHDPAAAPRLGMEDRGRRPRRGAPYHRASPLAGGEPRPRRRRSPLDPAARRVGPRFFLQVRRRLGPSRPRPPSLPLPDREEPAARLGRPPGAGCRRTTALRGGHQRSLVPGPDRGRPALDHTGADRSALGRASRALPGCCAGEPGQGRRHRPGGGRPSHPGLHLVRARAPRAAGPAGRDRQAPGRGTSARPAQVLAPLPPHLGVGAGAQLRAAEVEGTAPPSLLARPHLDQLRLADLDRPSSPRLRARGARDVQAPDPCRRPGAPARVLRALHRAWARRPRIRLVVADCGAGRARPDSGELVPGLVRPQASIAGFDEERGPGALPRDTARRAGADRPAVAKLIYAAIASVDGFIEDADGSFDWAQPDEQVHAFINDLERPVGTYVYGRTVGGPSLAADALRAGLVDEFPPVRRTCRGRERKTGPSTRCPAGARTAGRTAFRGWLRPPPVRRDRRSGALSCRFD